MIEMSVKKLVQYGKETGLIEKEDEIYARKPDPGSPRHG